MDEDRFQTLDILLSILNGDEDPFDRLTVSPGHFTASAFCLSPEMDALLLIFHPAFKRWIQPGGHFDPMDTTPISAAKRELFEETGVEEVEALGVIDLDVHEVPPLKGLAAHLHGDLRFWMRAKTRKRTPPADAHSAKWISLNDIESVETDRSVLAAVHRWTRLRR